MSWVQRPGQVAGWVRWGLLVAILVLLPACAGRVSQANRLEPLPPAPVALKAEPPLAVEDAPPPGVAPAMAVLRVGPGELEFGLVRLAGRSAVQVVTLTNDGPAAFPISSLTLAISDPTFLATLETCGGSVVAPGESCTIRVWFAPTGDHVRTVAATLVVVTAAGASPPIFLRGVAVQ